MRCGANYSMVLHTITNRASEIRKRFFVLTKFGT
jgi:hypothetical protein